VHAESDKNNGCFRSNLVNNATLIDHFDRVKELSVSMRDHFFPSGIGLRPPLPLSVSTEPGVIPCLIVIALSIKSELSFPVPDFIVVALEILPTINVIKVRVEFVAATPYNQVQEIRTGKNAQHGLDSYLWFRL
jgi:hypothetical protein